MQIIKSEMWKFGQRKNGNTATSLLEGGVSLLTVKPYLC